VSELGVYHVHIMKTGGTSLARMLHFPPRRSFPTPRHRWTRPRQKLVPGALLAMPAEERDQFVFVSTHMAAWVAEDLFPRHLSVTVLRDPVERTISHLKQIAETPGCPIDLEEIYEDPNWHSRLVNYQVQMFAVSRAEFLAQTSERRALDPRRYREPERARIVNEFRAAYGTSIGVPKVIDKHSYAEAASRLDRIDEVGVTKRLGKLVDRLAARLGREVGPIRYDLSSRDRSAVSGALRERIERDNEWDRTFYERALARQTG
jgi:tetrahydromethanopterin S-methyltransferase subunit G